MSKFISKDDRDTITKLNAILGTDHRVKPYDLNNPDDFYEMVTMITAEFVDIEKYSNQLSEIEEKLDESLEYYHPDRWFKINSGEDEESDTLDQGLFSLRDTILIFDELVVKLRDRCIPLWRTILLDNPVQAQERIFGERLE